MVGAAHPQGVPGRPPLGADADVPPDIARGFKSDGQGARADGNSRHGDSGDAAPLAPAGLQQPPAGGGHAAGGAPTVQVEKAEQQQQTEEARKKKQVEEEKAEVRECVSAARDMPARPAARSISMAPPAATHRAPHCPQEEKSKKVKALPTGVRPRQLLLPALMPLVMLLPITCIIVPVYFGEDRDQRAEASSQVRVRVVTGTAAAPLRDPRGDAYSARSSELLAAAATRGARAPHWTAQPRCSRAARHGVPSGLHPWLRRGWDGGTGTHWGSTLRARPAGPRPAAQQRKAWRDVPLTRSGAAPPPHDRAPPSPPLSRCCACCRRRPTWRPTSTTRRCPRACRRATWTSSAPTAAG